MLCLKDTPGMNNDDDDDTRTNESTRGSIYNTFLGLCKLAEKQMELSPCLFRKYFTNEQNQCMIVRKTVRVVRVFDEKNSHSTLKNLRPHISQLLFPPFLLIPTDAPQSSILIMKPTTTNHRNFRHLYSQPNIQFISYQELQYPAYQNQMMARTSSMPPSRNDDKKKDMLCTLKPIIPIYLATEIYFYTLSGLSKTGKRGWDVLI